MKSLFFVLLAFLIPLINISADDFIYNSSTIPEKLRENADVVIRLSETECTIYSKSKVKVKYNRIVTILNQRGLDEANIMLPYSSVYKVSYPEGKIYKADGKKYKSIKTSDVYDVSAISGSSLFSDNRIRIYEPPIKTTPFTIEYSYEENYDGSMFIPQWSSFEGYNVAVEKSTFKIIVDNDLDFKYKEQAISNPVKTEKLDDATTYFWEVTNQPAPKSEPYDKDIHQQFPSVYPAINDFEFYKKEGSLKDWKSLGKWISELNEDKQEVSEETRQKIKELISNAGSDQEKIERVYKYVQDKTHYLNIAIGIGGWQPIEAQRVDEVGYGDCKALTNYTMSLLNVAGIKAYYTLIYAGSVIPDFKKDFVSNQFNHVILCVPVDQDTTWLECTSQKMPAGYLSTFTDNRYALLINKDSSKLIKTPALDNFLNGERRKATVRINNDLSGEFNVKAYYSGEYENEVSWWDSDDEEQKRRKTYESLAFSDIKLNSYKYQIRGDVNAIEENLDFRVLSAGTLMGNRIIFEINKLNKETYSPKKVFNRRSDIEIQRSMLESDTIEYILPEGYILEAQIKPVKLTSAFGSYEASIRQEGNILTYIRSARFNKGIYDKSLYGDFVQFFQDIKSADQQKILLKPQES
ncbi:DUF3857 domain-containing protein [Saccharicrinis sp. FJH54]|uniref:DUF3857 domain-containing protein n=1 Tax=Saccharicrinis sp. FJH54 TaxID=3344665 RepID=UPI0035D48687